MKPAPECYACFLKQTLLAARLATKDEARHHTALQATLKLLSRMSRTQWGNNPPFIATNVFRNAYKALACSDPYLRVKNEYNRTVKRMYPELERLMKSSPQPIHTALKLAIAGNIIDFGILEFIDLQGTLKQTLALSLPCKAVKEFSMKASKARGILYIADNAGEIGFDYFLIRELKKINPAVRIFLAVKKHPIINDATPTDAKYFKLERVAELTDTGGNWVGTHPRLCSPRFQKLFHDADLIISKGQANWESLEELRDPRITFLLKAKCPVVAENLGVKLNGIIFR
ncbi:MAG: hypothetical protein A2293_07705 [Elusimicrobia bacterium RIFOXYB2_FULL_49_7]|nr:MAG: hypothetical protein A2293_07705 [Elusimicrobia bacterium RIFOXYB2_FULL_49_7]